MPQIQNQFAGHFPAPFAASQNPKTEGAANGAAAGALIPHAHAVDAASDAAGRILSVAAANAAASPESLAGRLAEEFHAGTFNVDAALSGRRDLAAQTTAAMGRAADAADIVISRNGESVAQAQVKYMGANPGTTFHLSHPKYDGMQKIHPSDQNVAELAVRRGQSGVGLRNYPDTAQNASPALKSGGVQSKALSRQDAIKMARNPQAAARSLAGREMAAAVKAGTVAGGAAAGVISAARNTGALWNGEKDWGEAAWDVACDTAGGAADSAVKSAASVGVKEGLKRVGMSTVARGSAPVAIAITGVDACKDVYQFASGEIDAEELGERTAKTAVKGAGTWASAQAAAAVGTMICPGAGTVVGAVVGGIIGGLGLSSLFD